jgi:hypothetical protein
MVVIWGAASMRALSPLILIVMSAAGPTPSTFCTIVRSARADIIINNNKEMMRNKEGGPTSFILSVETLVIASASVLMGQI